jgi:hypothetical protein
MATRRLYIGTGAMEVSGAYHPAMSRPFASILVGLCFAPLVWADPPASITMADAIPFAPDVAGEVGLLAARGGTADNIQQRCNLPQTFAQSISAALRAKGIGVTLAANPQDGTGPRLNIIIEGVLGFSGAWKGPKTLVLRGELRDGETLLGSFVVREAGGGLFKNTCEEFAALGEKAAIDIAKWSMAPKVRARLGSA